ncbi:hypothetical protein AAG570_012892 [Ranatra chinensis]|uniref:Ionotropic glutamate receptor C-terminal domain-containing protein n=1 Tax=Ranatra chinensis TaxID=642074 RepID=A0ABD0YF67_9HEMI
METLQNRYGFNYELIKAPSRSIGDEKNGILGVVAQSDVDMVAGFLPIVPGSHAYVSWGTELLQNVYHVIMKRPLESASGSGLLAPFDMDVWLLILLSLVVVGPVMFAIMWLRMRLMKDPKLKMHRLGSCVWFVYGALMKQGSTLNPETDSSRIMFATWWIFILILTAFYTANLTAFLTWSLFTLPIQSIDDIAKPGTLWFSASGGSIQYSITSKDDGDMDTLMTSVDKGYGKFIDDINADIILKMISEGWLYLDDSSTLTRIMFQEYKRKTKMGIEESKRCTFVITRTHFLKRSLAFAYPKESNLPDLFNPVVQRFVESGIVKHLANEGLPLSEICPLTLDSKERRLRNSDLFTTYLVVVAGFTSAWVVFCAELVLRRCWDGGRRREDGRRVRPPDRRTYKKRVNDRRYVLVEKAGRRTVVPVRTPSTLIFQYG